MEPHSTTSRLRVSFLCVVLFSFLVIVPVAFLSGGNPFAAEHEGAVHTTIRTDAAYKNDVSLASAGRFPLSQQSGETEQPLSNWSQSISGTINNLFSVHFVNANEGWAVGASNTILHTTNGGASWTAQTNQGSAPITSYMGVRFIDANIGWAGGGYAIMWTTNGGASWAEQGATPDGRFRNNLFAVSPTVAWIPTQNAVSTLRWFSRFTVGVGEENFNVISSGAQYYDMAFTDPDNGWAVGTGPIVRITNASSASPSFSYLTSSPFPRLNGIHMLYANIGWVVGDTGLIWKTTDGGSSWTPQTSGTTNNLKSVHFVDPGYGWAVGAGGTILATTDGGSTWTAESSGVSVELRRVFFVNASVGYAVGANGTILKRLGVALPTLGNYPDTTVQAGANTMVTPDAAPTGAFSVNVSTTSAFKGTFAASPGTGVVQVTNAQPAGTYPVTVTAFNSVGATTTQSFTLTVSNPTPCDLTSFSGAAFTVGLLSLPHPWSVAVGDFNGDGKQDLATANSGSNSVTVLLGDGTGGFSAASGSPFAVGEWPASVGVGDFNGDGKLDLTTANSSSNNVTVLLGDGTGGFSGASGSPYAAGSHPQSVAAGDFNGDGRPDLATANNGSNNVTVFLGDGTGGFSGASGSPFAVGGSMPVSLAVGDFNGDGKLDLTTANYSPSSVTVLLGDGTGGFTAASGSPFAAGAMSRSVAVGDFNGDSTLDLAIANENSNNVTVLLGNGTGGMTAASGSPFAVGPYPYSVAIGDVNGDGKLDLAVANRQSNNVTVLLGNGSGGFSPASGSPFAAGSDPYSVVVGDFNSDGKLDFTTANRSSDNVTVLLNTCTSNTTPTINAVGVTREQGSPSANATIADVNDTEDLETALSVTINGGTSATVNGVIVSGISVDTAGAVTADVIASCAATTASFTLRVTDTAGSFNEATLTVTVNANSAPTLTYASPQSVVFGGSLNLAPTATGDNGAVTYSVQPGHGLTTAPTVDASGVVSITNAQPAGAHTITIRATDNCGDFTDAAFTLNVGAMPTFAIDDITHNEGNVGTTSNTFTVTKTGSTELSSSVNFTTVNGTATTVDNDYQAQSGSLTFAPTDTTKTITILVNGDTTFEPDETFTVQLSGASNATIADADGTGTITNDDSMPCFAIDDVTHNEGNSGATAFVFTITKTGSTALNASVNFATVDGTATTADYQALSGTLTFLPADTTKIITVLVNGDTTFEPDEAFTIHLSNPSGGTICDADGLGTITNDDVAPPATLGNYPDTTVQAGANTTVTPDAAPTNTTSINVSTVSAFRGIFAASPMTGVVMVTNAHPAGTYPVIVTVFNSAGVTTTKTFTLMVTNPVPCSLLGFSGASGSPFAAVTHPHSVAVGDFNGDGNQDLTTTNVDSYDLTVLLGDGLGGFSPASGSPFAIGAQPRHVAVGDFNGDGKLDLATANISNNNVTVLLGNGGGGFSPAADSPFAVGTNPASVALGDFNGDGKLDLATANWGSSNVTVLMGNGSGGFSPASGSPFAIGGTNLESVAVGDFNRDGKLDLATANINSANVTVLLGDGSGGFIAATGSPFAVGSGPYSVAVGDFNSDGKLDLTTANGGSNNVTVLLGNGSGGFTEASASPFAVGSNPVSVAVEDFDGDGKLDLASANRNSQNVTVLLGNGLGGFSEASASPFAVGSNPTHSVAVGDFNADGKLDLTTANYDYYGYTPGYVTVLLNTCTSNTAPTISAVGVTRQQGSPSATATIANVNDLEDLETALTMTVNGGASATVNGVTVSGISVSAAGVVTANVVASCTATTATFTLRVTDTGGLFNEATLTVTVDPNSAPALVYSSPQSVVFGGALNVTPTSASDNGAITYSVQAGHGLTTPPTVDSSGVVSITNAQPSGAHTLTIRATDNCGAFTDAAFTLNVGDMPTFTIDDVTHNEGNGGTTSFVFTVTKNGSTALNLSVDFTTVDGTATIAGNDYQLLSGSLTFQPTDITKTITVLVNGDTTYEPTETFTVHLSSASGATISDADGAGSITNDDAAPAILVVNTTADTDDGFCSTEPGGCTLHEAINAANSNADANTINFNIPNSFISDGVFTIQPTSPLPMITKAVTIDGTSQATFGGDTNPNGPEIVINGSLAGNQWAGITLTCDNTTIKGLVVNGFGNMGIAIVYTPGGDYTPTGNQILDNYIGTNASATAAVPNTAGGMTLHGGSVSNNTISGNIISGNGVCGIEFCDAMNNTISGNLIGLSATGENLGNASHGIAFFCINAYNNTISGNTIAFNGGDGIFDQPDYHAGNNTHYGNRFTQNSIFSNTALGINLNPPPFGTIDGVTPNDLMDADTGANGLQNFPVITSSKVSGSTKTITGTLNSIANSPFTIEFFANIACDVSGNGEGRTDMGSLPVTTDSSGNASFIFNPASLNVGDIITATATNAGNNTSEFSTCVTTVVGTPGIVQFSAANYNDGETNADHTATITVSRTGGVDGSVDVSFDTSNGTALDGSDYMPASGTLHWNDGDGSVRNFFVTVKGDTIYEADETVILTLSSPQGGVTIGSPNPATLTITNDDSAPTFTIDDTGQPEGNVGTTVFTFTVTKTGSTAVTSTVDFTTVDGTATIAGNDYQANSGTLTFLPADTSKTITVLGNGDLTIELHETFSVHLSNASNATITDADGSGMIANDDMPVFSIDDVTHSEGNAGTTFYIFTVTKTGSTTLPAAVSFETVDGTATTAGNDYQSQTGSLTFQPSETTQTIIILVNGDTTLEPDETFTVHLSSPNGSTISDADGVGTITNDDVAPPTLGNYPNATVQAGANATISPEAAPTNTTSINVSANSNFSGTFAADPVTGVVRVTNAHPAGTFALTVTAFNGSVSVTRNFTLTVQTGAACTGASLFTNGADSSVGSGHHSVAIGDFNNDGKQDIAAANYGASNTVSIRLGDGAGGFTGTTTVTVSSGPFSVAIGDFNNDGKQDIATANPSSNAVSIRLGDGLGGFSGTTNVSVGAAPCSVAIGDFNNDGKQDMATANKDSDNVSVLLGNGSGGFSAAAGSPLAAGTNPISVAVGDFNGDGKEDLAVANFNSATVSIRMGDGLGGFSGTTEVSVGSSPRLVAIADFNNDGKLDIAAANSASDTVSIRLGDGVGGFSGTTEVGVGSQPYSVAIGDFNNDGKQDLAVSNGNSTTVSIRLGDGAGGFSDTTNVSVGTNPHSVAIGDFNHDGKQDLAVANYDSATISIRLGACNPSPTIAAASGLSRQQGSAASNSQIATVTDDAGNGSVIVTVTSANPSNGVTISNIVNTGGNITADIVASCSAATATFTLQASDGSSTATDTLTVTVMANTAPSLTYATPQSVCFGGSMNVSPTATGDNGTLTYTVLEGHGLTTAPTVDSSGVVSITNAQPSGAHIIVIRATDNCGAFTDAAFTLNVGELPSFAISDVSHLEGNAGTTAYVFTVTKTGCTTLSASVNFTTMDGTATVDGGDYQSQSSELNFAPADTTKTITILVNGDNAFELNETFTVHLAGASNATISDADGTGAITNDDSAPVFTIDDVTHAEGNTGTTSYTFTVTKTGSTMLGSTVNVTTVDGTATITGNDYQANADGLIFSPTDTAKQFTVLVNGDATFESDETFSVHLSGASDATIGDPDGIGAITNDDGAPAFAIDNVTHAEGNTGTTSYTFTVSKTGSTGLNSAVSFTTMDGTATTANNDYQLNSGTLTFLPAEITKPITVLVNGDTTLEPDETFTVHLSDASGATIVDADGLGTITNDDVALPTLGNYSDKTVQAGANTTVTPDAAPTGTTSINVSTTSPFSGTFAASPTTGVVYVTNAQPAGTYLVTVTAFNSAGGTTTKTFTLTITNATHCDFLSFSGAIDSPFAVGSEPWSVAVGDFNGDGKQDLATANQSSNNVTVLLGNGSGGFTEASGSPFAVGTNPNSVAVADFNGDGELDLATANGASHNVTVLLGDGSGSFSPSTGSPFAVGGSQPDSVAVGDFNGDGRLDLATANGGSQNVTVLLGDGSGGFSPSTGSPFAVGGSQPDSVAVGDFNGDGKLDLTNANSNSDNVTVLLGDGSGGFSAASSSPFTAGTNPYSVAVGDFNGDGKPDLATANGGSQNVTVLLGNGSGGFSEASGSPFAVGSNPYSVAVGDFNGDGKPDLVTASWNFSNVTVLLGNGGGGFNAASGSTFNVGSVPYSVAVGDFNADGKLDLTTANNGSNNVSVLLNTCTLNTAPTIGAVGVTRQQGSPSANAAIANVNDLEDPETALTVTVNVGASATVNGVTVSGISVSAPGVVTADVIASCTATTATFTLRVTDTSGLFNEATLTVTVNPNTAPALTYSSPQSVIFGGALNVTPTAASDNGAVTYSVQAGHGLTPPPTVDASGVVSITTAQPSGAHTITIRATDNCGAFTDAVFTLNVGDMPTFTIDDVTHSEGDVGTLSYTFTVTKTGSTALNSAVNFATVDGSATTAGNDYQFNSGALNFLPADTTKQITVLVICDTAVEPDEAFSVHLSGASGATISDADGTGAIINDDCDVLISTDAEHFTAAGGARSVTLTTSSACTWTAVSNDGFITITSGASGAGNGTVNYSVAANIGPARTGTMTIAGHTFTVTQDSGCVYQLGSMNQNFVAAGGPNSVNVITVTGCPWTAASNDAWITVDTGTPGSGNGTVGYSVAANIGPARTGTMMIAGITFTVTQDSGCTFTLSRDHQSFAGNGGNGAVDVTASDPACAWTASTTSTFVHITSGSSGIGNGAVQYSVDVNPGPTIRNDTLTVGGHTYTVYQGINFLDVPPTAVFYNEIGKLSARGVTLGCGSGYYCPNDQVLRDQMAAFIMRAKGEFNPPMPLTQRFADVPPENAFYRFIDRLAELQITLGCSPSMYCPSDAVKREQMAAFIIRGLGEFNPPTPESQRFDDVPPGNPFYKFIDRMAVLQITLGCAPAMYCPSDTVTRAQMAAFLVRAFDL